MQSTTDVRPPLTLEEIAKLETPCYVFDPGIIEESYKRLKAALGTGLIVSIKANSCVDLLIRCVHAFEDGIEVASLGELNVILGRIGKRRYVNTPALDPFLAAAAISCKASIVIDSSAQFDMVAAAHTTGRPPASVVLRVNAASLLGAQLPMAFRDHFGMAATTVAALLESAAQPGVEITGIHVFAGSGSFVRLGHDLVGAVSQFCNKLGDTGRSRLRVINLGGGFSPDWDTSGFDFARYRELLDCLPETAEILHEAGRAVFANGGVFITQVVGVKEIDGEHVAICDGGIAHCFQLAQTEQWVKRLAQPQLIQCGELARPSDAAPILQKLVGNSCSRADVIGELRNAIASARDYLVFDSAGAYGSYSPSGFLKLKPVQLYVRS